MDEHAWNTTKDPRDMLGYLEREYIRLTGNDWLGFPTWDRKFRLFACHSARRYWNQPQDARFLPLVAFAEKRAYGELTEEAFYEATTGTQRIRLVCEDYEDAAGWTTWLRASLRTPKPDEAARIWTFALSAEMKTHRKHPAFIHANQVLTPYQPGLLRELFGNPFRPLPPLPASVRAWQEGTVVRLAQAIHEKRDYERLTVLGDALEEAACPWSEITEHCHAPMNHVRGCWVIDHILGL